MYNDKKKEEGQKDGKCYMLYVEEDVYVDERWEIRRNRE